MKLNNQYSTEMLFIALEIALEVEKPLEETVYKNLLQPPNKLSFLRELSILA